MASVSALTCATLGLLLTTLSLYISRLRIRHRVSFGDGGHKDLQVAIRAHGNTLEQSMLFGLLLLIFELNQTGVQALPWIAGIFIGSRLLHSVAIFGRQLLLRQIAHVLSLLSTLALVAGLLWTAFA